jgi:ATP-dependent protease HslVU (ClpYQ) ATPase subunit
MFREHGLLLDAFKSLCQNMRNMVLWQDLYRILTDPEMNMIKQQQLLMKTEGIELIFTDEAIEELASVAAEV